MYSTATVKQILDRKGYSVFAVDPDMPVFEALEIMSARNVGALMVMHEQKLTGIFSERDYARRVVLAGKNEQDTRVKEVMTTQVIGIKIHQRITECLALMTLKYIRHLPVINDELQVVGVVSIGDVVKELTAEQEFVIDQLVNYITGIQIQPVIPENSDIRIE